MSSLQRVLIKVFHNTYFPLQFRDTYQEILIHKIKHRRWIVYVSNYSAIISNRIVLNSHVEHFIFMQCNDHFSTSLPWASLLKYIRSLLFLLISYPCRYTCGVGSQTMKASVSSSNLFASVNNLILNCRIHLSYITGGLSAGREALCFPDCFLILGQNRVRGSKGN